MTMKKTTAMTLRMKVNAMISITTLTLTTETLGKLKNLLATMTKEVNRRYLVVKKGWQNGHHDEAGLPELDEVMTRS